MQVYEEGTHIMIPWFERPIIYDVRARPNVIQSTSGSRDLQMVRAAPMWRVPEMHESSFWQCIVLCVWRLSLCSSSTMMSESEPTAAACGR